MLFELLSLFFLKMFNRVNIFVHLKKKENLLFEEIYSVCYFYPIILLSFDILLEVLVFKPLFFSLALLEILAISTLN